MILQILARCGAFFIGFIVKGQMNHDFAFGIEVNPCVIEITIGKAIADTANKNFGNVKIAFDVSCVVLALILSLLLFDFTIVGTREGTVISALCTGLAVKLFQRLTNEPVNRLVID